MGGKSQPDYGDIAAAEGAESRQSIMDQLYANRPTQYTPWGAQTWEQSPYTDAEGNTTMKWQQTTSLSPELQDIFNKQMAIQGGRTDIAGMLTGRMGGEFGTAMDWRGLTPTGQVPTAQYTLPEDVNRNLDYAGIDGIDDPYGTRKRAEDAMYNQAQSRIAPQQESQRAALETKMRNQGLRPGDQAWQSQMQSMGQQHNDQNNQAIWSATQAGRDESGQMFDQQLGRRQQYGSEREKQAAYYNQAGQQAYQQALGANQQNWQQSMGGSQYANQIRQQQIAEMLQQRGSSLNEINALLSGQQVGMPSMPSFQNSGQWTPANQMQAAAQGYAGEQAASPWNSLLGAGATLGGAGILAASDRRLKTNIKPIGTIKGYPAYSYDYIWGESAVGVMADEIPEKYVERIGAFDFVNYGALLGD